MIFLTCIYIYVYNCFQIPSRHFGEFLESERLGLVGMTAQSELKPGTRFGFLRWAGVAMLLISINVAEFISLLLL